MVDPSTVVEQVPRGGFKYQWWIQVPWWTQVLVVEPRPRDPSTDTQQIIAWCPETELISTRSKVLVANLFVLSGLRTPCLMIST